MKEQIFNKLLLVCNLLFIGYYLFLGYYNQPATDDYCVLSAQRYYGFHSPISYWYLFWNGRILPLYVSNIFLTLFQKTDTTIWYTIVLMGGFIFSINRLLNKYLQKWEGEVQKNCFGILNFAIFIFNVFVYNNFKFNTFYWLNASTMYFGGIMFFLLGLSEIISVDRKWYSYPLIIFSFAYAGTSTENHALVMVLILWGWLFWQKFIAKSRLGNKFLAATISLSICFLILVAAPGSRHRMVSDVIQTANPTFFDKVFVFTQNFFIKYLLLLGEIGVMYLPFFMLTLPVFIILFKKYIGNRLPDFYKNLNSIIISLIALVLLLGAAISPTIYIFGNIGPQRVLTIVNALLLTFGLYLIGYVISKFGKSLKLSNLYLFANTSLIIIIFQLVFRIYSEYPTLNKYASQEELNRLVIEKVNSESELVEIKMASPFDTPNLTERIVKPILTKLAPNQADTWNKILKHEPILPNIPDQFETQVYEDCYFGNFKRKVKLMR